MNCKKQHELLLIQFKNNPNNWIFCRVPLYDDYFLGYKLQIDTNKYSYLAGHLRKVFFLNNVRLG